MHRIAPEIAGQREETLWCNRIQSIRIFNLCQTETPAIQTVQSRDDRQWSISRNLRIMGHVSNSDKLPFVNAAKRETRKMRKIPVEEDVPDDQNSEWSDHFIFLSQRKSSNFNLIVFAAFLGLGFTKRIRLPTSYILPWGLEMMIWTSNRIFSASNSCLNSKRCKTRQKSFHCDANLIYIIAQLPRCRVDSISS
jgi:hypothetical protein